MSFDFDMGKNALYVWGAYGASAVVLIAVVADSLRRAARWRREAGRREPPR